MTDDWMAEVKGRVPHRPKRRWWAVAARPMPQMPLDVVTTPGVASVGAFGLRQMAARYVGPAINVQRSSDSATMDIGFRGPGDLDIQTLATFIGGGSGTVNIWYDQSGQGNNLTVAAAAPTVSLTGLNGKPTAVFTTTTNLHHAATPTMSIPLTVSAVAMRTGNFTAYNGIVGDDSGNLYALYFNSAANGAVLFDGGSISTPVSCADSIAHSLVAVFNGGSSTITVDNGAATTAGTGSASFVGLRLGVQNGGLAGNISEAVFWNGLMDGPSIAALAANQKAYWNTP